MSRMSSNGHLPPVPTRGDLEAAGIRIAVGVPLERTLPHEVFPYFWRIAQRGYPLLPCWYGRTDVNRIRLAEQLLDSTYTHVVMLDQDHLHDEDVIERLARWVLADPAKWVIGGMHFRRGAPYDPLMFVYGPGGELHPVADWPRGLIQVHALGHGSLLVSRDVFGRLPTPWWGYDYGRSGVGQYPTEDMYFCYLCQQAGIKLWVDTTISSPHLITQYVTEEAFRQHLAEHPEKVSE